TFAPAVASRETASANRTGMRIASPHPPGSVIDSVVCHRPVRVEATGIVGALRTVAATASVNTGTAGAIAAQWKAWLTVKGLVGCETAAHRASMASAGPLSVMLRGAL